MRNAIAALAALSTLGLAHAAIAETVGHLEITDAWSRATAPAAPAGGGYVLITNTGEAADRLVGVACACAGVSQVHEMKMDGGIMRMRELAGGLEIPPGESVALAPGGNHLMFMRLKAPFEAGQHFTATLTFERAGDVDVVFDIRTMRGEPVEHDHGAMKHGDMKPMKSN